MDHAELNFGVRVNAVDRLREPRQAIHAGNQNVVYTTILKVSQYRQPEVSPFIFRQIQS